MFNPVDSSVCVINTTPKERKGLRMEGMLTDEYGKEIWKKSQEMTLDGNTVTRIWDVDLRSTPASVHFLRLRITYVSTGLPVDDNTYWFPFNGERTRLTSLPEARIVGQMMKSSNGKYTVDLANSGTVTAFFVRMKVIRAADGEMIAPVFLDDNYIVLLPGEKKSVQVDVTGVREEERNTPLLLHLEGFNLPSALVRL
jgi:hypothetical protein